MIRKPIYMGTTKIWPEKTAQEVMMVLVRSGARQIASEYDPTGKITGLRFSIKTSNGIDLAFALPVRTAVLLQEFHGDKDRAERVAWRQLLRWVQAQSALIEVGMVRAEEVYVPYMLNPGTQMTLFESLSSSGFKRLAAPGET